LCEEDNLAAVGAVGEVREGVLALVLGEHALGERVELIRVEMGAGM